MTRDSIHSDASSICFFRFIQSSDFASTVDSSGVSGRGICNSISLSSLSKEIFRFVIYLLRS